MRVSSSIATSRSGAPALERIAPEARRSIADLGGGSLKTVCSEAGASEQVNFNFAEYLVKAENSLQTKFEWFDPFRYDPAALAPTNVRKIKEF